jgi:hypothetical protein
MESNQEARVSYLVETLKFCRYPCDGCKVLISKQERKTLVAVTHKSKTSFKTLDIMFKLPSRALNSTSWD